MIADQAERSPDATAVISEDVSLSYSELDERANQLAWHLVRLGVRPDTLVAVCAERGLDLIVALVGVLKAGGGYLPLDPDYPAGRLEFMLADSGARVLLTQKRLADLLPPAGAEVICLDGRPPDSRPSSASPPPVTMTAANVAYGIYTSGSTGRPKGVARHVTPASSTGWPGCRRSTRFGADDRVLQKTPASFDVSVWEFFWPLSARRAPWSWHARAGTGIRPT